MRYLPMIFFATLFMLFFGVLLTYSETSKTLPSALTSKALPEFTLPNLEGKQRSISAAIKGKPAIINLFASWCVPCLMEHPRWKEFQDKQPIKIIGIGWKDQPERLKNWLEKHSNPYAEVLVDSNGKTTTMLGITGVPETYIVDAKGIIRQKFSAPLTKDMIENEILPLLAIMEQE